MSEQERILEALGAMDDEQFKLNMLEVMGGMVLCIHWMRGTFNWMMHTGAVKWPSEEAEKNYEKLFQSIEYYESYIWEIVPARAMLVALRDFRLSGDPLPNDIKLLNSKDGHGRIPVDIGDDYIEDIRDVLRRLGAARIARDNKAKDAK